MGVPPIHSLSQYGVPPSANIPPLTTDERFDFASQPIFSLPPSARDNEKRDDEMEAIRAFGTVTSLEPGCHVTCLGNNARSQYDVVMPTLVAAGYVAFL